MSPTAIVVAQIFIFGLALWYALFTAARLNVNTIYLILSGLAVSWSTASAGFSRWVLSETLSSAACLWLAAECLNSIIIRRISTFRICIAIATCALLRWDMIWVAVPVVVIAYHLCSARKALQKCALVGGLSAIPYFALVARAALVGLTLVPPVMRPTDKQLPPGILSFWRAAAVSQAATQALLWGAWGRNYSKILVNYDPNSFIKLQGPYDLDDLIKRLALVSDGEEVPEQVDSAFSAAARETLTGGKPLHFVKLLSLRAYHIWTDKDLVFRAGYLGNSTQAVYFGRIADFERLFWMLAIVYCSVFLPSKTAKILATGLCLMVLVRTLFLASLTALEIRYLTPVLPAMQFVTIALWGLEFKSPSRTDARSQSV
jgi:hypothetical protein